MSSKSHRSLLKKSPKRQQPSQDCNTSIHSNISDISMMNEGDLDTSLKKLMLILDSSTMKSVNLDNKKIGNKELNYLVNKTKIPRFVCVLLRNNNITGQGFYNFFKTLCTKESSIKLINFQGNNVDQKMVLSTMKLLEKSSLKNLSVRVSVKTNEEMLALKRKLQLKNTITFEFVTN